MLCRWASPVMGDDMSDEEHCQGREMGAKPGTSSVPASPGAVASRCISWCSSAPGSCPGVSPGAVASTRPAPDGLKEWEGAEYAHGALPQGGGFAPPQVHAQGAPGSCPGLSPGAVTSTIPAPDGPEEWEGAEYAPLLLNPPDGALPLPKSAGKLAQRQRNPPADRPQPVVGSAPMRSPLPRPWQEELVLKGSDCPVVERSGPEVLQRPLPQDPAARSCAAVSPDAESVPALMEYYCCCYY